MASNFKPWVDSPTAGQQVQSASVFATDAQRVDGFKAGDPASALRVNSALRQANIVVAGLMQMCDDIKTLPSELSLMSTVTQVKNAIKAAIDELDATVLASAKSYTDTREGVINGKITNIQNQVTSNKNRLDELEPRVDTLENGTPDMTVGKAEMLTEPFAVGFDTATAGTGYVKFASVSLSSSYRSAIARFEVLDKNPINVQTNMCGVEVVARNMSATDVAVTVQLLYGSSQYLSKIYACVKKGAYPVLVDLYFNITSNNLMESIACIKPLFTFARGTETSAFAFISDNVLVTDLPTDTTNIRLSTVYTTVTEAKNAENAENATNDGDGKNIASTYATKAQISNPNLLINPDFSINQRGQESYSGSSKYTVDRWETSALASVATKTDGKWTFAISGVTGPAERTAIWQYVEDFEKYKGKTVTASIKVNAITEDVSGTTMLDIFDGNTHKEVTLTGTGVFSVTKIVNANATMLRVSISGTNSATNYAVSPEWIKLEVGSVATAFIPPLIAEELPKCQRYYCKIKYRICSGYSGDPDTRIFVSIPFPNTMRIQPTMTRTEDWFVHFGGYNMLFLKTKDLQFVEFDGNSITYSGAALFMETSAQQGCAVEVSNAEFDAEIY